LELIRLLFKLFSNYDFKVLKGVKGC